MARTADPTTVTASLPEGVTLSAAKQRLFAAALPLLATHGYYGVSVRDLAAATSLTPTALYAHVGSKHDLLAELITIAFSEHRDALRRALLDAGADPADQISALVRAHVVSNASYPHLARVANRDVEALEPQTRARVLAIRGDTEALVLEVIERGTRLGVFDPVAPILAATALGAMGVRVAEWWTPSLGLPVEVVADTYAEYAVRLLTKRR